MVTREFVVQFGVAHKADLGEWQRSMGLFEILGLRVQLPPRPPWHC